MKKVEKLSKLRLVMQANAGEQGKLFGSVTSDDVAGLLTEQGYTIGKKQIHFKEAIRTLGSYQVTVELVPEVKTAVALEVIQKA